MATRYFSILSQLHHLVAFSMKKPKMHLENGALIVSVDVDVGSKEIGVTNRGENDRNVNDRLTECSIGEIEEHAVPLFIEFFNDLEIPATFAIRGQLTEVSTQIPELLIKSPVKHEIASHGYYHRDFTNLSIAEAESELNMTSMGLKKLGIIPKSFVFPKNRVGHLSLLEKHGYKCYRGYGNFTNDGMYIEKHGQLYDIHPSFYLGQSVSPVFLNKIIDISIKNNLPFHVWFHPWNFGEKKESIKRSLTKVFYPLFKYAKKKEENGKLTLETMLSMTKKIETILG